MSVHMYSVPVDISGAQFLAVVELIRLVESEADVALPLSAPELALRMANALRVGAVPGVRAALDAECATAAAEHGRDLALAEAVLSWLADAHRVEFPMTPELLARSLVAAAERGER